MGPARIIMEGIGGAGKTTILRQLAMGEVTNTTLDKNEVGEMVENKDISFLSWDLGGRIHKDALYRRYYNMGTDAIIFVVDSTFIIPTAYYAHPDYELSRLQEEKSLRDAIFLILANKQDLPGALGVSKVAQKINFRKLSKTHTAHIVGCSALTGDGLSGGMDWLANQLREKSEKSEKTEKSEKKKKKSTISYIKGSFEVFKSLLPKIG